MSSWPASRIDYGVAHHSRRIAVDTTIVAARSGSHGELRSRQALTALEPSQLVARSRADGLARLASALGVAKTGLKRAVAARIAARTQVLDRLLYLGNDPAAIARTFRAASLRLLVAELGGFSASRSTASQRR